MILIDTSIWIDHLRTRSEILETLLEDQRVLTHPFVVGELAVGNIRQRDVVLRALHDLPQANTATDEEVLGFIDQHRLFGTGIGYVDAHLLAAVCLMEEAKLWSADLRLNHAAERLGVAIKLPPAGLSH